MKRFVNLAILTSVRSRAGYLFRTSALLLLGSAIVTSSAASSGISPGEIWISPHEFSYRQVTGAEDFYPNMDTNSDLTRDDYLSEVTDIRNWSDIVATGKTVVFGLHLGALSSLAFPGYREKPFTDEQLARLAAFVRDHHFKVSVETGGLRLKHGEKLIADLNCRPQDMTCAGEGKRTARFDVLHYLKRWIDVGGRIDYIVADHPLTFAARSIADPALNIRLDAHHDRTYITPTEIVQEAFRYFSSIDAELGAYFAQAGKPYAEVGFALIDGPSAYKVIGDKTGAIYPSRLGPCLLNGGNMTYETIVGIMAREAMSGEFSTSVQARLKGMPVIFDAGAQVELIDGNGAWNFERVLTAQHELAAAGFDPKYIIHPGVFAIGPSYSYTDADVTCLGAACDRSPQGVLDLANEMSQEMHLRSLEEYLRSGGSRESIIVEGWHRYPSSVGPAEKPFSWFQTASYIVRFASSAPSIVTPKPSESTRASLSSGAGRSRVLGLRFDARPSSYSYREDRYGLASETSGSYESIPMERLSASSIHRGLAVSLRAALSRNGKGWLAVHFGNPAGNEQRRVWKSGVSILVSDRQSIQLVSTNSAGTISRLATAKGAVPSSKIVNLRIVIRDAHIRVYADYKQVIDYVLPSAELLAGDMSVDAFRKDAAAFNVVTDWY